jgi:hypothetical protein
MSVNALRVRDALKTFPIEQVFTEYKIQTATDAKAILEHCFGHIDKMQSLYKEKPTEVAAKLVLMRLKATGAKREVDSLKSLITASALDDVKAKINDKPLLTETLDTLPPDDIIHTSVIEKLINPKGYRITDDGVFKVTLDDFDEEVWTPVLDEPLLVASESQSIHSSEQLLTLAYRSQNRWISCSFAAGDVAFTRYASKLANKGVPVDTLNSKGFVKYISTFRRANKKTIPRYQISESLGWYKDRYFILPHTVVAPAANEDPGVFFENIRNAPNVAGIPPIYDLGGPLQVHAQEWIAALSEFPWLYIGVCASLSAFLVQPLKNYGAEGFTVDMGGRSGTGKTTMQNVMLTVNGDPTKLKISWESTNLKMQILTGVFNNMFVGFEELKRREGYRGVKGIKGAQQIAYFINDGDVRSGATADYTLAAEHTCATVAGSTDESGLLYRAKGAAGMRARLVPVRSPPTGAFGPEANDKIKRINELGTRCQGYVGYLFLRYFVELWANEQWREAIIDHYKEARDMYTLYSSCSEMTRCANYIALIDTAMWFFQHALMDDSGQIFEMPRCGMAAIDLKFKEAIMNVGDASNETENQLLNLGAWLQSQPACVLGLGNEDLPSRIYAVWPRSDQDHLLLTRVGLAAFMQFSDSGFDGRSLINEWGNKGVIQVLNDEATRHDLEMSNNDYFKYGIRTGRYKFSGPDGKLRYSDQLGWQLSWEKIGPLFSSMDPSDIGDAKAAARVLDQGV